MRKAVPQFHVVWTRPPEEAAVIQAAARALRSRNAAAAKAGPVGVGAAKAGAGPGDAGGREP